MTTGNLSSLFGGIKSIQRGTILITGVSTTATISAVDTSKSELRYLGSTYDGGGSPTINQSYVNLVLTNSTTITATKTSVGGVGTVSWELTERY